MPDMKNLARLMSELDDQLVVCMRCGMCQAVCPLFAETGRESDVARGKLALLDGLVKEMFKDPKGVSDRLSRCLLCGSCSANCPSGVKVLDIFLKARAILAGYMGLSPAKKLIFRGMLAKPELFDRLLEFGSKLQSFFVKPVDDLIGTSCTRFVSPLGDRHIRALASEPFHRTVHAHETAPGKSGLKVALFTGCVIDKVFPDIARAVLRVMDHHGVGVYVPDELGCCGIPALSSGDTATFNALVRHNIRKLASKNVDAVITACATCTSTLRKIWPLMAEGLSPEEQARMEAISQKTMDVSQFLVDRLGVSASMEGDSSQGKITLTYHDPCHLKKSLGVAAQPRMVIGANKRYRLKEMAEADRCCGSGGSFNLQHYDISSAIGKRKRDNIVASGADVVATSCPACMLQISDVLSRSGDRIRVKHVIEIYAEALD